MAEETGVPKGHVTCSRTRQKNDRPQDLNQGQDSTAHVLPPTMPGAGQPGVENPGRNGDLTTLGSEDKGQVWT